MYEEFRKLYEGPKTCAELKKKVEAYREVFGKEPRILVSGCFRKVNSASYDWIDCSSNEVTKVGSKYLTVRYHIGDKRVEIDPLDTSISRAEEIYFVFITEKG